MKLKEIEKLLELLNKFLLEENDEVLRTSATPLIEAIEDRLPNNYNHNENCICPDCSSIS